MSVEKAILTGLVKAGVVSAAKETRPPYARPRFKSGRLKNEFDRLEEELDIEEANDPVIGPAYWRAHKTELDRYVKLQGERELAAMRAANIDAGGMTQSEYEQDRDSILLEEHNSAVDRAIEKLEATKKAPPEK